MIFNIAFAPSKKTYLLGAPNSFSITVHILDCGCNGIGYGYNEYFRNCCSEFNQCGINQGDCDYDR